MKKKFIATIIIFIFSFGILSNLQKEKEVNAIAIGIGGGVAIAKVIGILLAGATLGVGGYVIGDNAINPDDNSDFTDWITGEYLEYIRYGQQLPGQPPPDPRQLTTTEQAALNSMLTKSGIEVGTDTYNFLDEYFNAEPLVSNLPDLSTVTQLPTNLLLNSITTLPYVEKIFVGSKIGYILNNNSTLNELTIPAFYDGQLIGYFKYNVIVVNTLTRYQQLFASFISINNNVIEFQSATSAAGIQNFSYKLIPTVDNLLQLLIYGNTSSTPIRNTIIDINNPFEMPETDIPETIIRPENPILPENYTPTFKGFDLSSLDGLVSSPEEMQGIINGTIETTPERYKAIEDGWNNVLRDYLNNPNFKGLSDEEKAPETDPTTGNLIFGDIPTGPIIDPENMPDDLSALNKVIYWLKGIWYAILEIPKGIINSLNQLYNLLSTWFNQFWTKVNTLIDEFWMSFTDWWQDNFIYHWNTFQAWLQGLWDGLPATLNDLYTNILLPPLQDIELVLQSIGDDLALIPGLISDLAQPVLDLPGMIVTWFVPPPNEWEDVWEPLILLWHDKIEPVKSPFENLAFYETEYEDVSVNLEFNGVGGYFKILDYQYIKNYREPVKNILRSFFWILIVFFNLDQVHRLIRNQSIIKTYVRKIEPPEGNKK